jgi:hypothetical protein
MAPYFGAPKGEARPVRRVAETDRVDPVRAVNGVEAHLSSTEQHAKGITAGLRIFQPEDVSRFKSTRRRLYVANVLNGGLAVRNGKQYSFFV